MGAILDAVGRFWTLSGGPLGWCGSVGENGGVCGTGHDGHAVRCLCGCMNVCGFCGTVSSFAPTFGFGAE